MAIIANTFQSTAAKGNREQLDDVVSRITPEETPIYSMIGKESTRGTHPEWEIDTLGAPAVNAQLEGDEFTFAATTPVQRVGNYTQILRRDWIISATQDSVENAGNVETTREKKIKAGILLRQDFELAMLSNTASVGGNTRVSGGLPSWYTSNVSRGATGANGGFSAGTGLTVAATNGTQRAFTKGLLDTTMQAVYTSGGNVSKVMVSPYVKSVFVTFMSDANVASFRYSASGGQNTIIATAEIYEGPFGKVAIVTDRLMAFNAATARNVHLIDPSLLAVKTLRKMANVKDLAKTGDAEKGVILGEMTLAVKNEAGLGCVADVFGLSATT